MKKLTRILALALTLVMAIAMFAGCTEEEKFDATATKEDTGIMEDGVIKFGTNAEFEPFEFVDPSAGVIDDFAGVDIEIAKEAGKIIGANAKIENMEFGSLLAALENGKVDAVIAGMTVTDERKLSVDFTDTYFVAKQVMIVKEGSPIAKADDMNGKTIAVVEGYTGETVVKDTLGLPATSFKKGTDAVMELVNGKCDVVVIDSATAAKYVAENKGLMIVEDAEKFEAEEYAIAVKKGNTKLLEKLNEAIKKMKDEGKIEEFFVKYNG